MAYPSSVTTFPTRQNGQTIDDTWFNPLQQEVTAIETALLAGFSHSLVPSGSQSVGTSTQRWAAGWFSGAVTAGSFVGSGAQLTGIPETAISDGNIFARISAPETISGNWTFSGVPRISSTLPRLQFFESDAGAGLKAWDFHANGQLFFLRILDDSFANPVSVFTVDRDGNFRVGNELRFGTATGMINGDTALFLQTGGLTRLTIGSTQIVSTLPYRAPNGTEAAPSYSFSGDATSGTRLIATNRVAHVAQGIDQLEIETRGLLAYRRMREAGVFTLNVTGGTVNDLSPANIGSIRTLRITGAGSLTINGLDSSVPGTAWQVLRIVNARDGAAVVTLVSEAAGSLAPNRFTAGGNIPSGRWLDIWYDSVSGRWAPAGQT